MRSRRSASERAAPANQHAQAIPTRRLQLSVPPSEPGPTAPAVDLRVSQVSRHARGAHGVTRPTFDRCGPEGRSVSFGGVSSTITSQRPGRPRTRGGVRAKPTFGLRARRACQPTRSSHPNTSPATECPAFGPKPHRFIRHFASQPGVSPRSRRARSDAPHLLSPARHQRVLVLPVAKIPIIGRVDF